MAGETNDVETSTSNRRESSNVSQGKKAPPYDVDCTDDLLNIRHRVAAGESAAYDVCIRCDTENQVGECKVREALARRENQVKDWVQNLKDEINALTQEHCKVDEYLGDAVRDYQRFQNTLRASKACLEYRNNLDTLRPDDKVNSLLEKEINTANSALKELDTLIKKLREFLGMIEVASEKLREELKLKVANALALKSCQQVLPLLSKPYEPEEPFKPYEPENEFQWEKNVSDIINWSRQLRMIARNHTTLVKDANDKFGAELASDLDKTNEALRQQIDRDEHSVATLRDFLKQLDKHINGCRLRVGVFHDEFNRQTRQKLLEAWRLQRLNTRPGKENIVDRPVEALNEELREIQSRVEEIALNNESDSKLWEDMEKLRRELIAKLDTISKRLFANRENCLGMRRVTFIEKPGK